MELFDELHEGGDTVVLVTHEASMAAYARRIVTVHDGLIASDVRHPARHDKMEEA